MFKLFESIIKDIFEDEKPKKISYKERMKKGKEYEYKIKTILEKDGFKVYPNGYIKGKYDNGIDLIAYKDDEMHLIQCKCYETPPKQTLIRKFYGDCKLYEEKNENKIKNKKIIYRFITSCEKIDKSTEAFLQDNKNIKYEIIN